MPAARAGSRCRDAAAVAAKARARYHSCMTTRRALFAAALLPLAGKRAHGFALVPADAETEALVTERAAACAAGRDHERLRADLVSALARAGDEEEAIVAVRAALGTCPWCGCGLAAPAGDDAAPSF